MSVTRPRGSIANDTKCMVNPRKLEIGLRPHSDEIPYTLLLRIEAMGRGP